MQYDIEADWTLNLLCNYDCSYCISRAPREHPLVGRMSPEQYLDFFNATGKTWLLHLTGGEPFVHRDFVELCRVLTSRHFISLNSNLSSQRVSKFAAAVDPSRVKYIHCGVHVEQRAARNGWRRLQENIAVLRERGFPLFASLVMTPDGFAEFERAAERFTALGVVLIPKALRGRFAGRWYPQAYTERERAQFRIFSERAEKSWGIADRGTVNPLIDRHYLEGFPDFRDIPCSAGRLSVSIGYDGRIFRCGSRTLLGNIFAGQLTLLPEDRPCDDDYCPYWCLRYSQFRPDTHTEFARRDAPGALQTTLVRIRGVRREIGNRVAELSYLPRG